MLTPENEVYAELRTEVAFVQNAPLIQGRTKTQNIYYSNNEDRERMVLNKYLRFSTSTYKSQFKIPEPQNSANGVLYTDAFNISKLLKEPARGQSAVSVTVQHATDRDGTKMTWLFRLLPIDIQLKWWAATCTPFCPGCNVIELYTDSREPRLETLQRALKNNEDLPLPPVFAVYYDTPAGSVLQDIDSASHSLAQKYIDKTELRTFFSDGKNGEASYVDFLERVGIEELTQEQQLSKRKLGEPDMLFEMSEIDGAVTEAVEDPDLLFDMLEIEEAKTQAVEDPDGPFDMSEFEGEVNALQSPAIQAIQPKRNRHKSAESLQCMHLRDWVAATLADIDTFSHRKYTQL